ncbi:MAG: UvrD-helicase domain-containing protein [Alphaproteobacteria bacterium]|nr:UvrD-helicase domain-containing protein [Alphaproteobacteria bacterium]
MSDIFDLDSDNIAPQLYDNIGALKRSLPWLNELNPEQRQAVETTEGPLLVLSGAGTGKTKVLTTRLAYILSTLPVQPWNCLVVTFTNRAANEMKERVQNLIGDIANSVWLGTFHRICVKILRAHAELVGLHANFTILGEDDQKRLIKHILENEGLDDKKYTPQSFVESISRLKDKGITVEKAALNFRSTVLLTIYQKYQARLLELNAVDFGDILLYTLTLLMSNPEVLKIYQDKFKYIMVDEYQDTNVTQYLFLRLLTQQSRNLCCVGDDDQSIYSWRGAEIENIMRFQKDFTDAKVIRLERNYRSTANILSAASALIAHNTTRLGKTLKVAENSPAAKSANDKIKVLSLYNGEEEAKWVADEIETLHRNGAPYADMAVLVRTAFQTREFEEKFISEAIPYQVIGGPKFYERAEIRDILAYFRVIVQPNDDLAFERIINKPARGIGAKTVEKLQLTAREKHTSMFVAVQQLISDGNLSGKAKTNLDDLMQKFAQWRREVSVLEPADLAQEVITDSGYMEMLKNDSSAESEGRIENLRELINVMTDTAHYPTMAEFLEHVSLVMDNDSNLDTNKVMLITLHSAKGLEFDTVFLPGWEEGLFPHQKSLDEGGVNSLEEERRLAYVALTRAKRHLYITTTINRRIYGEWHNNVPSRFLNEIPPQCLNLSNQISNCYNGSGNHFDKYNNIYDNDYKLSSGGYSYYNKGNNYSHYGYGKRKTYKSVFSTKPSYQSYSEPQEEHEYSYEPIEDTAYSKYTSEKSGSKYIGVRVYHETFGYGKITAVSGSMCEVEFDDFGRKKVMGSYLIKA